MDAVEVLMVEDNPGDVVLLQEAVARTGLTYRIRVVRDGVEATDYLRRRGEYRDAVRPDLIVLDLKLPRRNGREVIADIRLDPVLCRIPLVVLSSSESELEAARSDPLPEGSCMVKPSTFAGYVETVESIEAFRRGKVKKTGG
jgi:CheY-like chemotaxis protein